ncbi:Clan CA, family C19, ubiquitin hydrolase-like cysteine peptidase [Tritrichomonas foetus]|uniref:Clan CA, family C19, ubiquitin hydrolase-like cysteine peptidase n=1 Tax=Tritrichomonas foetus TaxID=1144522 RepID=A0A1J4JTZ0_9EUKA|nr:Clan CA, family C19, ubiquitin hydrolase-like cysteine peptidase [Tritrichomonas foetus]|eukprot:OHT00717.1 Clan CA, family C19, ubiquitin hydrolase-like cysteine peptidase [Tritrichomonas foetus]
MTESESNLIPDDVKHIKFNDLIHRELLDFDRELHCSITSSKNNLFVCLSCGKAFSGGSDSSPIIQHFFDEMHPLALRLHDNTMMTLPDYNKILYLPGTEDILFTSRPKYTAETIQKMHEKMKNSIPIGPGSYELNSLVKSSARLSVIRFLSCIEPLRDFLLLNEFISPFSAAFSEFFKHFFNPFNFKKSVSPDKLIHILPDTDDPFLFISIILNTLSKEFGKKNVLEKSVRGSLYLKEALLDSKTRNENNDEEIEWVSSRKKIWLIPLEINDSPLYRSGLEKEKIIASTTLLELLKRYDGETIIDSPAGQGRVRKAMMMLGSAPKYLILNTNRIKKNEFNWEKNNMHIILQTHPLDFSKYGADAKYSLLAMISNDGPVESGEYLVYFRNKDANVWLKCTMDGVTEVLGDMAILSQCCYILFEKC